ncbi:MULTISPECIES: glycosyltransferase family 4 protein [unclassified Rhizobium]|uniref:glycosyltransferase family 4 protein n=1 Tax=unclassified Rhizobium TaxID=2613769 RepID=UPI001ADB74D4|nr:MULTISPECIES: glycosyltransferase family 4 protein [unclassified Rhizobium]MBO9126084.1 glycosyltransferase family 4 protein [Rhizobium sp. 16-488-2b]MBO9176668.1 glycosyltransferase family 4 protein [Rhizobium sp. 16-488-2a]
MSAAELYSHDVEPVAASAPLIVHVIRQFLPNRGGLEDVIANLSRETLKRGYRVRVVTLDSLFTARDKKLPSRETIDGIDIVRIPWSGSTRYPLAPEVFRHLGDADLIHVHAIDFFFDALAWGRFLHRKPMVVTTHGGFFHTTKFATIKKVWFQTITRVSAMAYKRVIGCSMSDLAQFEKIAPSRSILIENGADIGKFADRASRAPKRRIVTIGRFSVNKRLDRLIDALAVLRVCNPDWHLDIAGVESDLTRQDLMAQIDRLKLNDAVTIHVDADNAAVGRIIADASIFASASSYEGFGLVALEAMSAGLLPVLNTNEAYKALGERHKDILLADFADTAAAALALETVYKRLKAEGPAVRAALLSDASAYSWDVVAERYIGVYKELIAG